MTETTARSGADLALIVGTARSGTSLMRLLVDAHPEIGCPAEAGLPELLSRLAGSWLAVFADDLPDGEAGHDSGPDGDAGGTAGSPAAPATSGPEAQDRMFTRLSGRARDWLVDTVSVPMADYCARGGKRVYCDKSLNSVHHLPLVRELFPGVRSVLVFRHVMDVIASGIEASPWGFSGYGYREFVQATPENTVAALAHHWLTHVRKALDWEAANPGACIRVRYEDLVADPGDTIRSVFGFLGVQADDSVLERAFDHTQRAGPADHKIWHTSGVHAASVGRGRRVPVRLIPAPLLRDVNQALVRLGYHALGSSWNTQGSGDGGDSVWSRRVAAIMDSAATSVRPADAPGPGCVALVADDHPGLRWVIDPRTGTVTRGDGDAERVVIGSAEDLVRMIVGEENTGVLLRAGRIRHRATGTTEPAARDLHRELHWIVSELHTVSATAPPPQPEDAAPDAERNATGRPRTAWV